MQICWMEDNKTIVISEYVWKVVCVPTFFHRYEYVDDAEAHLNGWIVYHRIANCKQKDAHL